MPYTGSYVWKIRQKIGHDLLVIPTADCVAVRGDGKLLLIHNKDFDNWFFPGGYVEENSSAARTAAQELLEEGSLVADPSDLKPWLFTSGRTLTYPSGDKTQPYTMYFLTEKWRESNTEIDQEEVNQRAWLSIDEIKKLPIDAGFKKIIAAYEKFIATQEFQIIDNSDDN
jgi:ADP-ribose pyrophosphatase YjhB (NUDIX family)